MENMYCVKNIKTNGFLNYAKKSNTRNWKFQKIQKFYSTESPFPTLRPEEHILQFKQWIKNTATPANYKIVEFKQLKKISMLYKCSDCGNFDKKGEKCPYCGCLCFSKEAH